MYRDYNVYLTDAEGKNETPVTTEGSREKRIKYGTASWVYGEELEQTTALWWSPDSRKLAFYRFDESQVPDYYVTRNEGDVQNTLMTEAYPKAGVPNPVVDLYVYDLDTQKTTHLDVRDGKPFANETVGQYVYNVRWSPDGTELLFNRTNRRQNIMEIAACNPKTGKTRVIVRESHPQSWTANLPNMTFLKDGKRFLLLSERTGFQNLYLYNLDGTLPLDADKPELRRDASRTDGRGERRRVLYGAGRR